MTAKLDTADAAIRYPAFCTIDQWQVLSGLGRRTIYALLATGDLIAKKSGKRTLIDVQHGLRYLDSLPTAKFRAPKPKKAS
jgi:hypothetical protein